MQRGQAPPRFALRLRETGGISGDHCEKKKMRVHTYARTAKHRTVCEIAQEGGLT